MENQCSLSEKDILFNLEEGIKAEEYALDLYESLLETLRDEEDKKTISHIAADEERHIAIIKHLVDTVNTHYSSLEK